MLPKMDPKPKKTLLIFFFIIISVHGGVLPKCIHGSKDVYKVDPAIFLTLFNALNSACGLPLIEVTPDEITDLFLTTIEPTDGLCPVCPRFFSAICKARFKKNL